MLTIYRRKNPQDGDPIELRCNITWEAGLQMYTALTKAIRQLDNECILFEMQHGSDALQKLDIPEEFKQMDRKWSKS